MNTQTLYPVTLDGINYWVDKGAKIQIGSKCISNGQIVIVIGVQNETYEVAGFPRFVSGISKPIVAVEYPHKIEGLYQFELTNEDDELFTLAAKEFRNEELVEGVNIQYFLQSTFIKGYKANKAKWTDEDMIASYNRGFTECEDGSGETAQEYLQSLHKNKEIESYDIEMEQEYFNGTSWVKKLPKSYIDKLIKTRQVPKLDEDGLLIIHKINYK